MPDGFATAHRGVRSGSNARLVKVACPVFILNPSRDLRPVSIEAARFLPQPVARTLADLDRDISILPPERIAHEIGTFLE